MEVISTKDGTRHTIVILPVSHVDRSAISRSNRFEFDWRKPTGKTSLKLVLKDSGVILGLISITDRPEELAIEINMLESSKENVGRQKEYEGVAGCLIAYMCREAFKKGYNGFVCLVPKTELVRHYRDIYGMTYTGLYMFVDGMGSYKIIQRYIEQ